MPIARVESTTARTDDPEIVEPLCAIFRRRLKAEGLKYTPERARILDAIIQLDEVFEADVLLERMKRSGVRVSKATIYRTINLMEQCGILQQVFFDSDQAHYLLAYGRKNTGVIVRVDARQVIPVALPEVVAVRDRVCADLGLEAQGHRFVIYARGRST